MVINGLNAVVHAERRVGQQCTRCKDVGKYSVYSRLCKVAMLRAMKYGLCM